ncbi:MAG TPA: hypothetical protein VNM47_19640 [Terriglobia bacterium]|nr:hypothetical protein [Terriglobia bacterium]
MTHLMFIAAKVRAQVMTTHLEEKSAYWPTRLVIPKLGIRPDLEFMPLALLPATSPIPVPATKD